MEELRQIILKKTGIDVREKKSKTEIILVRAIFSLLLKEENNSLSAIGKYLDKSHASIKRYLEVNLKDAQKEYPTLYNECKDEIAYKVKKHSKNVNLLQSNVKALLKENKKLKIIIERYKEKLTPLEQEVRKLNKEQTEMLNIRLKPILRMIKYTSIREKEYRLKKLN